MVQLNSLRDSMNKTVLKDITLSEQQKEHYKRTTFNQLSNSKSNKEKRFLYKKINWALSFAVCLLLLGGTIFYGVDRMGLLSEQKREGTPNSNQNNKSVSQEDKENEKTYVDETLTKNDVHYRLLNSLDCFETVQGAFKVTNKSASYQFSVEYKLQLGDNLASYGKTTDEKGNISNIEIYNSKKEKILSINPLTKTYTLMKYIGFHDQGPMDVESHYSVGVDNVPITMNRGRPPLGGAHLSIFAYEIITNYLRDESKWEIIKQTDSYLDEPVIIIGGKLNDYASKKHQSETFKFWVHKPTGILLKYETYNTQGDVINSLVTNSFEWNEKLDPATFDVEPPEGFTDKTNEMFAGKMKQPDSREAEIEHIAGAKFYKDKVANVIEQIKEKTDFYYEFNDQDLEVFSASLEKYHEYYNVLTYINPIAWNEDGGKDFSLNVRQYNEKSFVRKVPEFSDKDGGKPFEEFTANGIKWEGVYQEKSKEDFRTFAIGKKDGIIYEVVGEQLNPEQLKKYLHLFKLSK